MVKRGTGHLSDAQMERMSALIARRQRIRERGLTAARDLEILPTLDAIIDDDTKSPDEMLGVLERWVEQLEKEFPA